MYVNSNNYIRKIDELGRIVIPKEVRNKLKLSDNENILISCDDKVINISKYSHLDNYQKFLSYLAEALAEIYKIEISIYDRDKLLFTNNKNYLTFQQEEDIIKDSTNIGKIIIYSNSTDQLLKLSKLIARVITIFLST